MTGSPLHWRLLRRVSVAGLCLSLIGPPANADDESDLYGIAIPHTETSLIEAIREHQEAEPETAPAGAEAAPRRWDRVLPFLGQQVIDLGYELPDPFGAQIVYTNIQQDLRLSGLKVAFGAGEVRPVDFVDFSTPRTDANVTQFKLDAWVLPFMNVFGLVGQIDGHARIPLAVPGDELLRFVLPSVGQLCDLAPPLRPAICDETLQGVANVDFEGTNYGAGVLLAGGWRRAFVVFTTTWARNDLDSLDGKTTAWDIAGRVGVTVDTRFGDGALYTGVDYLIAEVDITDTVILDTSSDPNVGQDLSITYKISQKNADRTNYLFGGNWSLTRQWQLVAELGFGGSRSMTLVGITRRF